MFKKLQDILPKYINWRMKGEVIKVCDLMKSKYLFKKKLPCYYQFYPNYPLIF